LSDDCGRCNRESKCGYEYKPKQFFADNPSLKSAKTKKRGTPNYAFVVKNGSTVEYKAKAIAVKSDYIPLEQFKLTLGNYDRNAFVQFLLNLFPDCSEEIQTVLKMYFVGTYEDYTCFPSIDRLNRICKAKLIKFNPATGKRLKGDYDTSSLVRKLKLKEDFNYKQIFFGEHLLRREAVTPVAVVESEKTAILASLCMPQFIWLATGSKQWLKVERLQRLDNRQVILYPDADGFELWQAVALDAQRQGLNVKTSRLIENFASSEQKQNQYDLADYLIEQQNEINKTNSKLEMVLSDESLFAKLETVVNERISILEIDGNLSRTEAETIAYTPDYLRSVVMSI
jgi:hypothetical protein